MERNNNILQTIGIAGAQRGVGVTHLAIMLSNYIKAKGGQKVCVVEANETGAFIELKNQYAEKVWNIQGVDAFSIAGVTYVIAGKEKLDLVYNQAMDYVVLDFGEMNRYSKDYITCSKKIMVGNLNPWNSSKMLSFMESFIAMGYSGKVKYVSRFGPKEELRQIKASYKHTVKIAPNEPDPFLIHGCYFDFLESLL